jgi:pantoate--beta-alanine ligase
LAAKHDQRSPSGEGEIFNTQNIRFGKQNIEGWREVVDLEYPPRKTSLPLVVADPAEIHALLDGWRRNGATVGLVPTMGNLHAGHASLLRRARRENDRLAATIFVNPLQFNDPTDLAKYPRTMDEDLEVCRTEEVDVVFAPSVEAMYPKGATTIVQVRGLEDPLCGRSRPGHFIGVATVVAKLFHLCPADRAYFGLKDFQQAALIKRMVRDLNFPIEIRTSPTVREPDGLAMSSRNRRLTPEERAQAVVLHRMLTAAQDAVAGGDRNVERLKGRVRPLLNLAPLGSLDYLEFVDPETLEAVETVDRPTLLALAVKFGGVRLIDNAVLAPEGTV